MTLPSGVSPISNDLARSPLSVDRLRGIANSQGQAEEVGRHFEALLIQEVVKAARSASGGGWLGEDAGETSEATAQMGEEFLANAISAAGGFGLASLFAQGVQPMLAEPEPRTSPLERISGKI